MSLDRIIPHIKRLPATPQILPKLMQVLKDPNTAAEEIVEMVKLDTSVAAQVQRLSNSPYYGFTEPSRDLQQAIIRIGMQETYKLVATVLSQQITSKPRKSTTIDANQLWEKSIATAIAMELLADHFDTDAIIAYSVGLFHNIGLILISYAVDAEYKDVIRKIYSAKIPQIQAEQEVLGFDHIEAAVQLLKFWKFPEDIWLPISLQYTPSLAQNHKQLCAMINIAHAIVDPIKVDFITQDIDIHIDEDALKLLKLTINDLEAFTVKVEAKIERVEKTLTVTKPR
jgi:HD-like signal output (HDOD) protein